jgi:hypothetical protein
MQTYMVYFFNLVKLFSQFVKFSSGKYVLPEYGAVISSVELSVGGGFTVDDHGNGI